MPFYEYSCEACASRFDVQMSMSENTSRDHSCPKCGSVGKRVYLAPRVLTAREGHFGIPEEDEPIWAEHKQWVEKGLAEAADGREWVPGRGVPQRFQPDMARVAELRAKHQAKQAAAPATEETE